MMCSLLVCSVQRPGLLTASFDLLTIFEAGSHLLLLARAVVGPVQQVTGVSYVHNASLYTTAATPPPHIQLETLPNIRQHQLDSRVAAASSVTQSNISMHTAAYQVTPRHPTTSSLLQTIHAARVPINTEHVRNPELDEHLAETYIPCTTKSQADPASNSIAQTAGQRQDMSSPDTHSEQLDGPENMQQPDRAGETLLYERAEVVVTDIKFGLRKREQEQLEKERLQAKALQQQQKNILEDPAVQFLLNQVKKWPPPASQLYVRAHIRAARIKHPDVHPFRLAALMQPQFAQLPLEIRRPFEEEAAKLREAYEEKLRQLKALLGADVLQQELRKKRHAKKSVTGWQMFCKEHSNNPVNKHRKFNSAFRVEVNTLWASLSSAEQARYNQMAEEYSAERAQRHKDSLVSRHFLQRGYRLYTKCTYNDVRASQAWESPMAEITKEVARRWHTLSKEEQLDWANKAAENAKQDTKDGTKKQNKRTGLSAFQLFAKLTARKLKQEQPDQHRREGVGDLFKMWQALPEDERQKYVQMRQSMNQASKDAKDISKLRDKIKDANPHMSSSGAFSAFVAEKLPQLRSESGVQLSLIDVTKRCSQLWKVMSMEEKQKYHDIARHRAAAQLTQGKQSNKSAASKARPASYAA